MRTSILHLSVVAASLATGCTGGESDVDEVVCGAPNDLQGTFDLMEGCTRFRGSIHVSDSDLVDMSGLDSLRAVDGYVSIFRNRNMTSLHGLENLETVGEFMSISIDDAVEDLDALTNLRSVGGDLTLSNLGVRVINLPSLCTIEGTLGVLSNPTLESLDFDCLRQVGGDLDISRNDLLSEHEAWRIAARLDVHGEITIYDNLSR